MWLVLDVVKHKYHPSTHFVLTGCLHICKFPFVTAKSTDYNYYEQKIIPWEKHYTITLRQSWHHVTAVYLKKLTFNTAESNGKETTHTPLKLYSRGI